MFPAAGTTAHVTILATHGSALPSIQVPLTLVDVQSLIPGNPANPAEVGGLQDVQARYSGKYYDGPARWYYG